jgi:hypothetical protein
MMQKRKKKEKENEKKAKEKEKEKGKGKGKGWLSLYYKARHCLLCCNTIATKVAPSCFDRLCVANTVKGTAHKQ